VLDTCHKLQVAAGIIQEGLSSHSFATTSIIQSIALSQGRTARAYNSTPSSYSKPTAKAGNRQLVSGVQWSVTKAVAPGNYAVLQYVRQSMLQTEARTAALERQLVQPANGEGDNMDQTPSTKDVLGTGQNSQKEAGQYMECLSGLMGHMAAKKHLLRHQGHTQHLQSTWPLSVAPSPEQQASSFSQARRASAPLQSRAASHGLSQVLPLRLQLPHFPPPLPVAVTAEQTYWQAVSISSVSAQSVTAPANGKLVLKLELQQLEITALQASPNTTLLALGSISGVLTILSLQRNSAFRIFEGSAANYTESAAKSYEAITGLQHYLHGLDGIPPFCILLALMMIHVPLKCACAAE